MFQDVLEYQKRVIYGIGESAMKDTPQHVAKISEMNADKIALLDKNVKFLILERRGIWTWLTMKFQPRRQNLETCLKN